MVKTIGSSISQGNIRRAYAAVFLAAAALYVVTCAPGSVWQDGGLIQYRVWHNDIEGRLGLALAHPLYYLFAIAGKHTIPGEFGRRVNVVTALISAFAVANMFLLLRLWLKRSLPALVGSVTLCLSHTFWWHATTPETYNLATALLLAELIMLVRFAHTGRVRYLYALALINGLAVANHMLASIASVCYVVLLLILAGRRRITIGQLGAMALLWAAGALPYEYLIAKSVVRTGDLWGTLSSAMFGVRWRGTVLNTSLSGRIVKENLMWISLNYPTPNILLLFVGLWSVRKVSHEKWLGNMVLALLAAYLVFAFRYTVPDRYAFFTPFYCMGSVVIGVGAYEIVQRWKVTGPAMLALSLLSIPAYAAAPAIAEKAGVSGRARDIPYRDDYRYFLRPWKTGYRGAERFAEEVLAGVEQGAIIVCSLDGTTAPPLLYVQQIKGRRPDVKIIAEFGQSEGAPNVDEQTIDAVLAERAVYVVSPIRGYCPDFLLDGYDFEAEGLLWRVIEKRTG
ncbi:MAG: DUF2723 domain-containing protein [Phycisphaerales bacterium]|nr:MAG: DUF2723 domain-containing protein [Phycisphaerales bacterium]